VLIAEPVHGLAGVGVDLRFDERVGVGVGVGLRGGGVPRSFVFDGGGGAGGGENDRKFQGANGMGAGRVSAEVPTGDRIDPSARARATLPK